MSAAPAETQTEQAAKPPQISKRLQEMADKYGLNPTTLLNTLKATIFPAKDPRTDKAPTNEQLAMFIAVCEQYSLNPFTREIYAFPSKQGGIVPIVSVDGWCNLVNSHPAFDGVEFVDQLGADVDGLVAITAKMYRRDRSHPIVVTEYMCECLGDTNIWKRWPARMLRHKAYIQAARYAFGFAGIYDRDEAERILSSEGATEITATEVKEEAPVSRASALVERLQALKHPAELEVITETIVAEPVPVPVPAAKEEAKPEPKPKAQPKAVRKEAEEIKWLVPTQIHAVQHAYERLRAAGLSDVEILSIVPNFGADHPSQLNAEQMTLFLDFLRSTAANMEKKRDTVLAEKVKDSSSTERQSSFF